MNIFVVRMSFFVDGMYFARSWDVDTSRWILVHQLFLYYILTTSKLHPNYENVHPNYEKGHPYYEKVHPIYDQTTSQLRGRRLKEFKKCLISFNQGQILEKYRHRGHYFLPSFVFTEFRFALMFPFNYVLDWQKNHFSQNSKFLPQETKGTVNDHSIMFMH